jgi:hypothetical protein
MSIVFYFLTKKLTREEAEIICDEIVESQYHFWVRAFAEKNELTRIDENRTLPIEEDPYSYARCLLVS